MRTAIRSVRNLFAGALALAAPALLVRNVHGSTDLLRAAMDLGLTAESITMADLQSDMGTMFSRLEANAPLRQQITQTQQDVDELGRQLTAVSAQILSSDDEDDSLQASYSALATDLVQAQTNLTNLQGSLFTAVTDGIPTAKVTALQTWSQSAARRVPAAFRVLVRTDEQWTEIERALRLEQYALRNGIDVGDDAEALLASIRLDSAVVTAEVRLATNLTTVSQQYIAALLE